MRHLVFKYITTICLQKQPIQEKESIVRLFFGWPVLVFVAGPKLIIVGAIVD